MSGEFEDYTYREPFTLSGYEAGTFVALKCEFESPENFPATKSLGEVMQQVWNSSSWPYKAVIILGFGGVLATALSSCSIPEILAGGHGSGSDLPVGKKHGDGQDQHVVIEYHVVPNSSELTPIVVLPTLKPTATLRLPTPTKVPTIKSMAALTSRPIFPPGLTETPALPKVSELPGDGLSWQERWKPQAGKWYEKTFQSGKRYVLEIGTPGSKVLFGGNFTSETNGFNPSDPEVFAIQYYAPAKEGDLKAAIESNARLVGRGKVLSDDGHGEERRNYDTIGRVLGRGGSWGHGDEKKPGTAIIENRSKIPVTFKFIFLNLPAGCGVGSTIWSIFEKLEGWKKAGEWNECR